MGVIGETSVPIANVILIGLRGAGKSTIGRLAAARLGWSFVDLDELTPREMGYPTVGEAWLRGGEPSFRAAEVAALRKVLGGTSSSGLVIALGGGTPTAPGADQMLRDHRGRTRAAIIYLRAGPAELRRRLEEADNSHRPALIPADIDGRTGAAAPNDLLAEVETIHARRDPLYRTLADVVVETEGLAEAGIVDLVVGATRR